MINSYLKSVLISPFLFISLYAGVTQIGQTGLVRTFSAKTMDKGRLEIHANLEFSKDENYILGLRSLLYEDFNDVKGSPLYTNFKVNNNTGQPGPKGETGILRTGYPMIISLNLGLTYGLSDYFEVSGSVPYYMDRVDNNNTTDPTLKAQAIGDPTFAFKIQYPPYPHPHFFDMAYHMVVTAPLAPKNKGIFPRQINYLQTDVETQKRLHIQGQADDDYTLNSMYSSGTITEALRMLWSMDFGQINPQFNFQTHVNYGVIFLNSSLLDNSFLGSLAMEYSPVKYFTLFVDFDGRARFKSLQRGMDFSRDPLKISPGISINTSAGVVIKVAIDRGLSRQVTPTVRSNFGIENLAQIDSIFKRIDIISKDALAWNFGPEGQKTHQYVTEIVPKWGIFAELSWGGYLISKDRDKDGIIDSRDACPDDIEDIDGFDDSDGCPDYDNDKDNVPDKRDKCPDNVEDTDGFEDEDGCPDPDNDNDGLPDVKDKCPNIREDMDGHEDFDGCAEGDNDVDGIDDNVDRCPTEKEDMDGFEDNDGCPDIDNDKDGILDVNDKCPMSAGSAESGGCPSNRPNKEIQKRMILKGVNFRSGSAELEFESYSNLNDVFESIVSYPEVLFEIRGYTDNQGGYEANQRLSQQRADAVRDYLVRKGFPASNISAMGYGPDNPIATNRTAAGRAQNRRIEIVKVR